MCNRAQQALNRIALHFLPYRHFSFTGSLPAASFAPLNAAAHAISSCTIKWKECGKALLLSSEFYRERRPSSRSGKSIPALVLTIGFQSSQTQMVVVSI
jgi:hypothetical protein